MKNFDFNGLFIYDLANNHQGDVEHAVKIIRALGEVTRETGVRGAFKFQFRELDSFIHPAHRESEQNKHIKRFLSTRLKNEDFARLTEEVRKAGMTTICTPFDEASVDLIEKLKIEIIKIASCSATDRPLLQRVAAAGKPVIASTAGLDMRHVDRLVSFFEGRGVSFALMHCVAIYPTPPEQLRLNQIEYLRSRYPSVPVGFSTHENPEDQTAVQMAYALGARLFERHVGLEAGPHKLNAYSSTPEQAKRWIKSYQNAVACCGGTERCPSHPEEIQSLRSLRRGAYAKRDIAAGQKLERDALFFAMPLQEGQLDAGTWNDHMVADRAYQANEPVLPPATKQSESKAELVFSILLQVQGMLNNARIFIGKNSTVEISHHYGLERFREFGAVIVNCINRAYCKKLVVLLPRQKHPYHFHQKKEETFQLLSGDLEVELEGRRVHLHPGDTLLVEPNRWHKFHTLDGAIFEECSTTHFNNDSFYEDERIAQTPREKRKTFIANWENQAASALETTGL